MNKRIKVILATCLCFIVLATSAYAGTDTIETVEDCIEIVNEISKETGVYLGLETEEDQQTFFEYYKGTSKTELREILLKTAEEAKQIPDQIYINAPDEVRSEIESKKNSDQSSALFLYPELVEEEDFSPKGYKSFIRQYYRDTLMGPWDNYASNPGSNYRIEVEMGSEIFIEDPDRMYTGNSTGTFNWSTHERWIRWDSSSSEDYNFNSYKTALHYSTGGRFYSTVGLSMGSTRVNAYFYLD